MTLKILVLAVHYEVTGARYIADAFTRLGHDVKHVGTLVPLKEAWGIHVPDKYRWTPCELEDMWSWKPDLIIIADTQTVFKDVPRVFNNIPVIKWITDNHVRNVREDGIAHYFLAHAHGPAQPVTQPDETWLPCAADLTVFKPSPQFEKARTEEELAEEYNSREYDICCIGVMYPRRVRLIERLKAEGFKVFAATGLVYEEYTKAYQNARISLCVSAAGDIAQRVFETAAIGCTVLTDVLNDLLSPEDIQERGLKGPLDTNAQLGLSGFAVYNNDDECVTQARALLGENLNMAIGGALTLQKIVRERHSWDDRCKVVVGWFEANYGGNVKVRELQDAQPEFIEPEPPRPHVYFDKGLPQYVNEPDKVTFVESPISVDDGPVVTDIRTGKTVKPYLNLGCGRTHFPSAKPAGHELVDDSVYSYPLFVNIDKVEGVGADMTFDLFAYPWPLPDSSFDGAVLAHIVEHIPHEIKIHPLATNMNSFYMPESMNGTEIVNLVDKLKTLQDGFYAFFSELYRVLTPGAIVHIVSPYGFSDGGITDPSHHRYLTMNTFTHSMTPEISDGATFKYNNGGINFQIDGTPMYRFTPYAKLMHERMGFEYDLLMGLFLNMCYDFYLKLKAVK